MTTSRHIVEAKYLEGLEVKTPIKWGKMDDDDNWSALDDNVYSKLHKSNTIFERLQLLEDTLYSEATKIFGHQKFKQKKMRGKSRRTKHCIMLVQEKNKLLAKLKITANPTEIAGLKDLLIPIKEKIKSVRRAERQRKKRWLFKKSQFSFKNNPYLAGKTLLDPRSNTSLSVKQAELDQYKEAITVDDQYQTVLGPLEGLPPDPSVKTPFFHEEY